jgi:phage baseplate assembly protein W
MQGMNAATGRPLDGAPHLIQSIRDILLTPKGSRVMLRDYGSDLYKLVDRPLTAATVVDIYAATIGALGDWEPRLKVKSVSVTQPAAGHIELALVATYLPDGKQIKLDGIVI